MVPGKVAPEACSADDIKSQHDCVACSEKSMARVKGLLERNEHVNNGEQSDA